MKVITCALQKGGVGKTSLSVSIAALLARKGRTLILDCDPQGNTTTWIKGDSIDKELADVLNEKCSASDAICATSIKNLFIIATAGLGGDLREYQKTKASGSPFAILDLTDSIKEHFDYCVIDTSPNFDPLNESIFLASDEILTVLQLNEFSKDGFQIFTENLAGARKRLHIPSSKAVQNKIILNAKDSRIRQQLDILGTFRELEKSGYELFIVPVDQAFNKAQAMHTVISEISGVKDETLRALDKIVKAVK